MGGLFWSLPKGFFSHFTDGKRRVKKKIASNDVEGLLIAAMLIANKEAYTLIYRA
jgi:hypothetical protein